MLPNQHPTLARLIVKKECFLILQALEMKIGQYHYRVCKLIDEI